MISHFFTAPFLLRFDTNLSNFDKNILQNNIYCVMVYI